LVSKSVGWENAFGLQLQDLVNWMQTLSVHYGYFGIFLISLIGAASIFFPIPSTVVIFALAGLKMNGSWVFEPFWIAVAAGIGSATGEFTSYLIGFGGRKAIGEKYKRKMDVLMKVFNKYGWLVIFIFALTPLPDDLLFIPLGIMRYSVVRIFVPALIGKFCMNLIIAYCGRFSIGAIQSVFGAESDWVSVVIGMVLAIAMLVIVLVIMFRLDWDKYLEKHLNEKEGQERRT
jgi:membrane protein YqaA with SNARE-associated domain